LLRAVGLIACGLWLAAAPAGVSERLQATRTAGADVDPAKHVPSPPPARVLSGIDVLRAEGFTPLEGQRVALLTNRTGVARDGRTTTDLLHEAPGVTLVALFSPEHGIRGELEGPVSSGRDGKTGLPIHSLYGESRRPSAAMFEGVDTLVIDLVDIGARFFTYKTTMAYALEEAATHGVRVVVLDRPNPIGGLHVEGPTTDTTAGDFVNYFPMPIRHGLTMGELARLFNEENGIGAELTVVELQGWRRNLWFDETGLPWVNPSPNIRTLTQAALYPGIGAIERTNLSVGRGTDTPFEQVGAPWIDGPRLAETLNARELPGARVYPVSFTPSAGPYAGEACQGVFIVATDRDALRPVRLGLEIGAALQRLYGDRFDLDAAAAQYGSRSDLARIRLGEDPAVIAADWAPAEARWRRLGAEYALYP
jgi:uncharacterized protein YbbC (DUF1343 family)